MTDRRFQQGDQVVHTQRPEWGPGQVMRAEPLQHEGRAVQRLTIRFLHKGRTTLNTAYAAIALAETVDHSAPVSVAGSRSSSMDPLKRWQRRVGDQSVIRVLSTLPEEATDPFRSVPARLTATLSLYRFGPTPRDMIDWSIAQTQLPDPLSHLSRADLEEGYHWYQRAREDQLRALIQMVKRSGDQATIDRALAHRLPAARAALKRVLSSLNR